MKRVRFIGYAFSALALFAGGCNTTQDTLEEKSKGKNKVMEYKNIVILSDLSSRISNLPNKDLEEIDKLLVFFKDKCVQPGRKLGDRSSISFSTFSGKLAAKIDIEEISNLSQKQKMVNHELDDRLRKFKDSVINIYETTRNPGLDLISVLIEKIQTENLVKDNGFYIQGKDTTFINYDNQIHIFTDGYLEYIKNGVNNQFYFGVPEIDKVRKYCQLNSLSVHQALEKNPSLGLPAFRNEKYKNIALVIRETHDRGFNRINQTYQYPLGLRDNEILEAVWRKWALDSGFRSLEWLKY